LLHEASKIFLQLMNDKTLELLTRLADKFGTTVDHLWGVLVKQASLEAVTEILLAIAVVALWLWAFRFVTAKTKTPAETPEDRYPHAEWRNEVAFVAWLIVAVGLLIALVQVSIATTTGITALLNPEYWALKQLLP
jgi:hypothetical protein